MNFSFLVYRCLLIIVVEICLAQLRGGGAELVFAQAPPADWIRDLQTQAVLTKSAPWGHWGSAPSRYSNWTSHSNRLIPVYVYGGTLAAYADTNSLYRDERKLAALYGEPPLHTLNPAAQYLDQTDIFRLQEHAWQSGKKYIFLLIADGMDWQTTQAAAIYHNGGQIYREGRGQGLSFQDYTVPNDNQPTPIASDFGWMVTSASHASVKIDVDAQRVVELNVAMTGGYNSQLGGAVPWAADASQEYLMGRSKPWQHLVTDSASSATSMTAGIKTYNSAINVDIAGREVEPIARRMQREGWAVGVVTSVPISHATPAAAYANNVDRDDYQDLTRDLLGIPSAFRHAQPLPGVDVLIGCGWGEYRQDDRSGQGANYVPGNRYLAESDRVWLQEPGRPYVCCERTADELGSLILQQATEEAIKTNRRLFGFFGTQGGHLPYRTADGDFRPTRGVARMDTYSAADIRENPRLPEMTQAALSVLHARSPEKFWLMVEAGDVDWANHNNNVDDSIGAVLDFADTFAAVTAWIEQHDAWQDSLVVVTADHGHGLRLIDPRWLTPPPTANDRRH